ncbi:right-handed parallel beta-helix repeat-containing protein [Elizabethkingia sp. JS20170427COW]|uniref:right-handed parallel beta-helix repeat-containing protein n=1 Tax=Elizabethkingia sp. JS20170427COW TaxID=2583851 RepID=UPI001110A4C7|nr:right-handed parallel beta-helix repeat-containing protein [Elizabethkingia sp. JS20170427COW]QCX53677.1 right-handed parallel beta-helix repeat-containing protein [Elizabethkingia sp. JS20170427COW]
MYKFFLTLFIFSLHLVASCQTKEKVDVLKLYQYKDPFSLISNRTVKVNTENAYKVENNLSKNRSTKENTMIIQEALNKYDKVLLPNFSINIERNGLKLKSNQVLIFQNNTQLNMEPNELASYAILHINGVNNVKVYNAKLRGDKEKHIGVSGEAGHGISILGSSNVEVLGFDIRDFWGDGIFIGRYEKQVNKNVLIEKGIVDNNRRNGISIVSVEGLVLKNVVASNSNGTMPMFGVDIEPHFWVDEANNIKIINLTTYNNANGGLMVSINKIKEGGDKEVNINISDYTDINSYHGISLGGITSDFKGLRGSLNFKKTTLINNIKPIKLRDNHISNFTVNFDNFNVVSPKNKYFTTKEATRLIKLKTNFTIKN